MKESAKIIPEDPNKKLKWGIWAYFLLLIFEGALRKWFLPGLATPLLIIRDPIALWLLIKTWQSGQFPSSSNLAIASVVTIISIFTAIFLGHGNLPVALFGARIMLLHFPLIYVIGKIFTKEDVLKMGKVILWISIPIALLVVLQFFSPQTAWVNRGVGGDEAGAGFSGTNGYYRPSATFSFTTGTVAFFSLSAIFVMYFLINTKNINKLMLIGATIALIIVIPLSISRSLFFGVILLLVFALLAMTKNPRFLKNMIVGIGGLFLFIVLISNTGFFKTGIETFTDRFETANDQEGGLHGVLIDRFLGGAVNALSSSGSEQPFFGLGLGLGTNVGSKITTGNSGFLIAEGEWARVIGELGPLMGLIIIFVRLRISWQIAYAGFRKMITGNILPWLFLSNLLVNIPQGQWAQASSLGFSVLIGGLALASLKSENSNLIN